MFTEFILGVGGEVGFALAGNGFEVGTNAVSGGEDFNQKDLSATEPLTEIQKRTIQTSEIGTRTVMGASMISVASTIIASPRTIVYFSPALFIFLNN